MTNPPETLAEEVCRIAHPGRWDFVPAPRWPCQGCQDVAPVIANSIERAKAEAFREGYRHAQAEEEADRPLLPPEWFLDALNNATGAP